MAIHVAFALALLETLALAAVLWVWAPRVPGARQLVLFLIGVALWIAGNDLPNWLGPDAMPAAMLMLSTAPLSAAAFWHVCLITCQRPTGWRVHWGYGAAAAASLLSVFVAPSRYETIAGIGWMAVPSWTGWVGSAVWGVLAAAGSWTLLQGLRHPRDATAFRQTAAVALSCGMGLFCMSGHGIVALGLPWYPWPLLGLPFYPLILVYGMLRYRVFVANAWARRALAWAMLIGLGLLLVPLTLTLPVESRWLSGAVVAAVCLGLNGPLRRVAERLVYPGAAVSAADLAAWRRALGAAETFEALAAEAGALLSQRLGTEIRVVIAAEAVAPGSAAPAADAPSTASPPPAGDDAAMPQLHCQRGAEGWATRLQGWDAAPPGPRHLAELFGVTLADAAQQVDRARLAEQRERERQLQARLAELGALAATVAHDLRNPLNIISMAVAMAPADTRREVAGQVARLSRLAEDLLDYAKPWQLKRRRIDLAAQVAALARRHPGVALSPAFERAWWCEADPQRIDQALGNLLANALRAGSAAPAAAATAASGRDSVSAAVWLDLDDDPLTNEIRVHVCDNGPGVPAELRERLFQPFASRSPGGTGLGLAIVARIAAAHGGSAALSERAGWTTCFTLRLPRTAGDAARAAAAPLTTPATP